MFKSFPITVLTTQLRCIRIRHYLKLDVFVQTLADQVSAPTMNYDYTQILAARPQKMIHYFRMQHENLKTQRLK